MEDQDHIKYLKYKSKYLKLKSELEQEGGVTAKSGVYYFFCRKDHAEKIYNNSKILNIKDINLTLGATADHLGSMMYFMSRLERLDNRAKHEKDTPAGYAYRIESGKNKLDLMRTKTDKFKTFFMNQYKKFKGDALDEKHNVRINNIGTLKNPKTNQLDIFGSIILDKPLVTLDDAKEILPLLNVYNRDIDTVLMINVGVFKDNKFLDGCIVVPIFDSNTKEQLIDKNKNPVVRWHKFLDFIKVEI